MQQKKEKLLAEENKLIEKRKNEIASSAQRLGLLTASDELMTGLFLEAVNALKHNSNLINGWEMEGALFLKSKKQHTEAA